MINIITDRKLLVAVKDDYEVVPESQDLYHTLCDAMIQAKSLGISANQIGIPARAFVMGNYTDRDTIIGVVNPKIVNTEGEPTYEEETCASFPGLFLKVRRPPTIRVRFTLFSGVTDTYTFDGITARIFQHQIDVLDAVTMDQLANKIHLDQAKKKRAEMLKRRSRL